MPEIPQRIEAARLPPELQPLWRKLTEVRALIFSGGHLEAFVAGGALRDAATAKLSRASASKQQVADEWAQALISGERWATAPAVAVRVQKALSKLEQFGRRIPGLEIPIRITNPLDVFDVGRELDVPAKASRKEQQQDG